MNLPTNIVVFLIGFGNRKYPVLDSYSETIASALKKWYAVRRGLEQLWKQKQRCPCPETQACSA